MTPNEQALPEQALKACPFCGGEAQVASYNSCDCCGKAWNGQVICQKCRASRDHFDTDEEAIAAWNIRPAVSDGAGEVVERLSSLSCVMVESCEPHPGNPSPNIIPVERAKLLATLSQPASGGVARVLREALLQIEFRSTNHGAWFEQDPFGEYSKLGDIARAALAAPGQDEGEGS